MAVATGFYAQFRQGLKKWAFSLSGYNKYGLLHDDILYETPEVAEALRRLPEHEYDERTFRIIRAAQLSLNKNILPKSEWTKFEEDRRYLQPYIEEVVLENKEKAFWNSK